MFFRLYLWTFHPTHSFQKLRQGRGWHRCGTALWKPRLWWGSCISCGNTWAVVKDQNTQVQLTADMLTANGGDWVFTRMSPFRSSPGSMVMQILVLLSPCTLLWWWNITTTTTIICENPFTESTEMSKTRVSVLDSWRIDWLHGLVDLQERTAACKGTKTRKHFNANK